MEGDDSVTIQEAIAAADEIKPNAFNTRVKLGWINALEGRLALEVFLMAPAEARAGFHYSVEDLERPLLVHPPHDDLYVWWLQAQIDLANGEYEKAANTMEVFNAVYSGFVCWFAQTYDPAQGYRGRGKETQTHGNV